jgi:predicted ATPase/DNA-binding CsgD family transcriptional regulator
MDSLDKQPMFDPLTERELEILRLIADGLSDREIAQKLVISLGTVKWYNKQIYSKMGVHSRTQAVAQAREAGLFDTQPDTPTRPTITPKHNLPAQITSFVGRECETAQVKQLLGTARLLTLTGPPGTGKTRLGLQAVAEVVDDFDDGVCFVALASIRDPALVASAIAQVLGVTEIASGPPTDTLKNFLHNRQMLLVLDNFEHVLEAAPLVSDLLAAATQLKVLVTSREVLRLYGEQEFAVTPLALPDLANRAPVSELAEYEAVALFVERTQAVWPNFQLTDDNASTVAEICVRLDGLPLAIELSAARMKIFGPGQLLERLASRLEVLTGGARDLPARQRTLRATIDWSYNLLDEVEKTLFARLGVFQGGCDIEATQAVCCHNLDLDVLDGLELLLVKSLLRREEGLDGEPRFVMPETIHEYARERLEESGEAIEIRRNHANYFVTLAETVRPELEKARHEYWTERLAADHENIRAALTWSLGDGKDCSELGLRLASALTHFWFFTGHGMEGEKWFRRALEIAGNAASEVRADALNGLSMLLGHRGALEESKVWAREALRLYTEAGDRVGRARSLMWLSHAMTGSPHEREEAVARCEEGLAVFREVDDRPYVAMALNILGEILRMDGDFEGAKEAYEECLALSREMGNKRREGMMLVNLGYVAQHQGDYGLTEAYFKEAIILFRELGLKYFVVLSIADHAGPALAKRQPERAVRLLGASEALCEAMGVVQQPADQGEIDRYVAAAREQLDEVTFEAAWVDGRTMTLEEAVAYALCENAE